MTAPEAIALIAALSGLLVALAQLTVALRSARSIERTHELVNGQSKQLRAAARARGRSDGLLQGRSDERAARMGRTTHKKIGSSTHRPPSK